MRVLAIETSCDESSAAVVEDARHVRSLVTISQVALHAPTGGVVPEVAAREHVEALPLVVRRALEEAGATWAEIDRIAVTRGPGLIGSLLVGVSAARALAQATGIPLVGIHHVRGHIAANWLDRDAPSLPAVALTVSGGHNDLFLLRSPTEIEGMGSTLDDAAGEAFDKVARLLGLGYPGGPAIERAAMSGDPAAFDFPRARMPGSLDMSFSGLKSAVRRAVGDSVPEGQTLADLAASFQEAVVDVLAMKAIAACRQAGVHSLHLAGGVSANQALRARCSSRAAKEGIDVLWPVKLVSCTDNAAMIGAAGCLAPTTDDWRTLDADASLPLLPLHV